MRQGAEGQCTGTTLRKDMRREMGRGFRIRDTYTPVVYITRASNLPLEKPVCRSGSNSYN